MTAEENEFRYPEASLGVVSTTEGLKRADGTNAGGLPRGCPACNRDERQSAASLTLEADLPLQDESDRPSPIDHVAVRLVIDYCPKCGRVYDVRCAAR